MTSGLKGAGIKDLSQYLIDQACLLFVIPHVLYVCTCVMYVDYFFNVAFCGLNIPRFRSTKGLVGRYSAVSLKLHLCLVYNILK